MPPQAQQDTATPDAPLQPAAYTSHFVQAGDLKLHYLDYGTAGLPPMLCIHGSAAHAHWFDFAAPGFTQDYHVRALDLRGHGESESVDPPSYLYQDYASDIDKAVQKLDLRDFVLIGHSMGGIVSLFYAATYPGRAKKLIIVDSAVNLSADRLAKMREVGTKPGRPYPTKDELVARYKLRPGESRASPEIVKYIASRSAKQADDGTWGFKFDRAVYATRVHIDGRPLWNKIKIPALLVRGGLSSRITAEVYADARARAPQLELADVSNSGHHIPLDNPSEFIDVVRRFLVK
jgi:pimeloyl-ACP methyl ester carboxylesterase